MELFADLTIQVDTLPEFVARILAAIFFGICIGVERQLKGHTAGIQTNALVCTGSCVFTLMSFMVDTPEPTRIAAGIVSGIGFLCSGIIFKDGSNVKGINTATTIWCTASIGVIAATGYIIFGAFATILVILVNLLFKPIDRRMKPIKSLQMEMEEYYSLKIICEEAKEISIRRVILDLVKECGLTIMNLESGDLIGSKVEIRATLLSPERTTADTPEKIVSRICVMEGVYSAGWKAE